MKNDMPAHKDSIQVVDLTDDWDEGTEKDIITITQQHKLKTCYSYYLQYYI